MRCRAFDRQALARGHRPVAIERPAKRVDDAPQQSVAHGHIHDPARALDFIAGVQMPVFAEQHDADFVLVHVERDAEHIAGKLYQLLKAHAGEPGHLGDAGGDAGDRAHLPRRQLRRECFPHLVYSGEGAVEHALQAFRLSDHGCFVSGLGSSGLDAVLALVFGAALALGSGAVLGSGLSFSFRSSPTPFSSDAR